jgi:putative transposase
MVYRARKVPEQRLDSQKARPSPARKIPEKERVEIRDMLNSQHFQDQAPREVYAALLDEGHYLCDWRTMYRILHEYQEVRERRNILHHPSYSKPELLATKPNELWSWDITKLRGPQKGAHFYLYVILDVYSRYVVGWMIAAIESAALASELIIETCCRQGIQPGNFLTLHADRGAAMTAKSMALLLADLGVTKTHSRPYVSNDNPYSEAQFKTLKYRPDYPYRFGDIMDARAWSREFFEWYNHEHYHSGIHLLTPADVHYGRAEQILRRRHRTLLEAYERHPERFVNGPPSLKLLSREVWINAPRRKEECATPSGADYHQI